MMTLLHRPCSDKSFAVWGLELWVWGVPRPPKCVIAFVPLGLGLEAVVMDFGRSMFDGFGLFVADLGVWGLAFSSGIGVM